MPRSEVRAEIVIAAGLFAAIAALFVVDPNSHKVDPGVFALCVGMLALSHAARIDLPNAWTSPVQLAIVPTVFLLPAWLVPLTLISAIVLARVPEVLRGETRASRLLLTPGNAWFTVGPAAVLLAAGSPSPQDAAALLLVAMLAAQIGTDFVISSSSCCSPAACRCASSSTRACTSTGSTPHSPPSASSPRRHRRVAPTSSCSSRSSGCWPSSRASAEAPRAARRAQRCLSRNRARARRRGRGGRRLHGRAHRDVVALSVAVAERLGLDGGPPQRRVRRAAARRRQGRDPQGDHQQARARWTTPSGRSCARHTIEGQRMLDRVGGFMREVGLIVRCSHERWDGDGYPDGLAGEAIPLEARIICACDAYNAMTTTRRYREASAPPRRPPRAGPLRRHAVRPEGGGGTAGRGRPARGTRHAPLAA